MEIRIFEGEDAYLAIAGKPLLGGHGRPLEILNFDGGNAYLGIAGKPSLGEHAMLREAIGDP